MLKKWETWLGVGVSILSTFLLIITLRNLHIADLWQIIINAQYSWLIPAVIVYFIGVWARVWRWHYLLRPIKIIPLSKMWAAVVIGYMGNNIYPLRAGEFIRAYVLKRSEDIPVSAGLATVLVERIFDGVVMVIFVLIALPTIPNMPTWLRQTVIFTSLLFSIALLIFFAWATMQKQARKIYIYLINLLVPSNLRNVILSIADSFTEGLNSLRSFRDVMMVFITSVIAWLCETTMYWLILRAFYHLDNLLLEKVSFVSAMLVNGVVNLATMIPSAPGYIGTFDVVGVQAMSLFNIEQSVAAAYILVLHATLWLPITLFGLWYMFRESISWQEFSKVAQKSNKGLTLQKKE
ncbi:MAG: hypothetical protein B6242_07395 [Anaerolineaceae bacterium 4572_78]|nr:MAG: hypothetical protein B6242_07395 [Anaerolineaceae bacterium 4572_78]